ncbi:MAG: HAD family hydrolase [Gammaproteobacteria bacterium]|nr:HAD family hydrolase [Gammaproteobacteria bacterium]
MQIWWVDLKLAALVFDVDGTIAETEEAHRQSFNHAFIQEGLSWHWSTELYSELLVVTGGQERIRHYLTHYSPELKAPDCLPDFIEGLHKIKTRKFHEALSSGRIPLRPGVKRLIQEMRAADVRLGIATTTTHSNVITLLETSMEPDAPGWFDVIAAGDVVPRKKPAPDVYHLALQELGGVPDACLVIEDSQNGLRSALDAGLKTVITVSQYTQTHNFSGASLVVDHLGEPDMPSTASKGSLNASRCIDLNLLESLLC